MRDNGVLASNTPISTSRFSSWQLILITLKTGVTTCSFFMFQARYKRSGEGGAKSEITKKNEAYLIIVDNINQFKRTVYKFNFKFGFHPGAGKPRGKWWMEALDFRFFLLFFFFLLRPWFLTLTQWKNRLEEWWCNSSAGKFDERYLHMDHKLKCVWFFNLSCCFLSSPVTRTFFYQTDQITVRIYELTLWGVTCSFDRFIKDISWGLVKVR